MRLLCWYDSDVFDDGDANDHFLTLCEGHGQIRPIEDDASLVGSTDQDRAVSLLEYLQDANEQIHREIEADLDQCIQRLDDQRGELDQAIAGRDVIGQAKDIIMVRWRVDPDIAFEMLRRASSRSHRKLHDVVDRQLRREGVPPATTGRPAVVPAARPVCRGLMRSQRARPRPGERDGAGDWRRPVP